MQPCEEDSEEDTDEKQHSQAVRLCDLKTGSDSDAVGVYVCVCGCDMLHYWIYAFCFPENM